MINSPDARAEGFGAVNAGRLSLMASQVSDAFEHQDARQSRRGLDIGSLLPPAAELEHPAEVIAPCATAAATPASGRPFVDFQDVWLAYNEELLRANHFAVEAIDLKVTAGRVHRHRRAVGLRQVDLHEADHRA